MKKPKNDTLRPFLPLNPSSEKHPLYFLTPYPQEMKIGRGTVDLTKGTVSCGESALDEITEALSADLQKITNIRIARSAHSHGRSIQLRVEDLSLKPEGYTLSVTQNGVKITGQDQAGLNHGVQTLLQLAGFGKGVLPILKIRDWPLYRIRSVMLDMGRGIYRRRLIERCIRIMARLKLNMLHLHLYDDQLMGIRFRNLPLGKENPGAIPIRDLKAVVDYARQFNIAICPEMESWGHVHSVLHHYPECYGADSPFEGASFGIGPATISLLGKIYEEVVPCLENDSWVHLGLDEAKWKVLPIWKNRRDLNPAWWVGTLHELLTKTGQRHGKNLRMCIWADHGGRPVPVPIRKQVMIEPWQYYDDVKDIRKKVRRCSGSDKPPFLMGAGKGSLQFNGAFGATRIWCENAGNSPNCEGVTICLWEGNALDQYLISLYAGADSAWNGGAHQKPEKDNIIWHEYVTGLIRTRMMSWQMLFEDADESAIIRDRGPSVYRGYYTSGPCIGQPVAPTATLKRDKKSVAYLV